MWPRVGWPDSRAATKSSKQLCVVLRGVTESTGTSSHKVFRPCTVPGWRSKTLAPLLHERIAPSEPMTSNSHGAAGMDHASTPLAKRS